MGQGGREGVGAGGPGGLLGGRAPWERGDKMDEMSKGERRRHSQRARARLSKGTGGVNQGQDFYKDIAMVDDDFAMAKRVDDLNKLPGDKARTVHGADDQERLFDNLGNEYVVDQSIGMIRKDADAKYPMTYNGREYEVSVHQRAEPGEGMPKMKPPVRF